MSTLKETDVARPVVLWLQDQGWEVYQEVKDLDADIVAVQGRHVWIVEAKRFLNWKVISQACRRLRLANWVSVAVPRKQFHKNAEIVLRHWGIGCLEAETLFHLPAVHEHLKPRMWAKPVPQLTWDALNERQKTYCEAGSPGGRAWSPFKDTCERLLELVQREPGIPLKDAIHKIRHHYASSASAKKSLATWIHMGKVPGIHADRSSCLKLFPVHKDTPCTSGS